MSAQKIRELNDAFRTTMIGGEVMITAGVDALSSDVKAMVIRRVATFSEFNADNDPHHEHDFGSFTLTGRKFFFKLDYYERRWSSARKIRPTRPKQLASLRLCSPASIDRLAPPCAGLFHAPGRPQPSQACRSEHHRMPAGGFQLDQIVRPEIIEPGCVKGLHGRVLSSCVLSMIIRLATWWAEPTLAPTQRIMTPAELFPEDKEILIT